MAHFVLVFFCIIDSLVLRGFQLILLVFCLMDMLTTGTEWNFQLFTQLRLHLILAIRHHVVQMLCAKNVMVLDHAPVYLNTRVILMQAVALSVFSTQTVIGQRHVYETNVWTHAQALVVSMQSVVLWIMLLRAAVCLAILATLSVLAIFLHLVRQY